MVVSATLFSVTTIIDSVATSLKKAIAHLGADIIVVRADAEDKLMTALLAGKPSVFYMEKSVEEKIMKIKGVKKAASQTFLKTAQYASCCEVSNILMIGFEPARDFTIKPLLSEKLKRPLLSNEVIMGMNVALTAYTIGATVKLYGRDFKVVGMLEDTGIKFIDSSIFIPYSGLREIVEGSKRKDVKTVHLRKDRISTVLVRVWPGTSPAKVAASIEHDIPGVKAIVSKESIFSIKTQLFAVWRIILAISVLLWIMSLLLIGVIFLMIINERQREIGLLRAMGAKKRDVFSLIMTEASILSASGGLAGIICGSALLYFSGGFIVSSVKIPYQWPSTFEFGILISLSFILSFLAGTGAALYPTIKSAWMEPYDAIHSGK
ncbi:FtsX-like permease family protein [bacterium BMS3Abin07]|nr:FtsX-like permease family protein [bacterium BMS3Abin07]GBE31271.1 FtsX-like permease family protein [bacterium BMS3Bbin05]HDL20720.1 FtsX-like permease family protein [Nitrospirota bacterium]HDO22483.1 FtsX-like permease family protein [Nitrospirota bacterium]